MVEVKKTLRCVLSGVRSIQRSKCVFEILRDDKDLSPRSQHRETLKERVIYIGFIVYLLG